LLYTLAFFLVEAVLKEDPNVGLILIRVLQGKGKRRVTGELGCSSFPSLKILMSSRHC
jgi:hypothetical protein